MHNFVTDRRSKNLLKFIEQHKLITKIKQKCQNGLEVRIDSVTWNLGLILCYEFPKVLQFLGSEKSIF